MAKGMGALLAIRTKFLNAFLQVPHMLKDSATGLSPLAGGSNQATADARYTALRTKVLAHYAKAGAAYGVDGVHIAADGTNGATMSTVPNGVLATLIICVGQMKDSLIAHATQSGVHLSLAEDNGSDPALAALTIPVDPPVTLANCVTDLNTLLTAIDAHFARASS